MLRRTQDTIGFWVMIWKRTFKISFKQIDLKSVSVTVIGSILVLFGINFSPIPNQITEAVRSNVLWNAGILIAFSMIAFIFLFVGNLIILPAVVYEEQSWSIRKLDAELHAVLSQPFSVEAFNDVAHKRIGIWIKNWSTHKVTNLHLTLENAPDLKTKAPISLSDVGFAYGDFYDEPGCILGLRRVTVHIAEVNKHEELLLKLGNDYIFSDLYEETDQKGDKFKGARIPIVLKLSGYIEGQKTDDLIFNAQIDFRRHLPYRDSIMGDAPIQKQKTRLHIHLEELGA